MAQGLTQRQHVVDNRQLHLAYPLLIISDKL